MAVNCAILSYNGTIYFGFSGDVHAAPDLKRMESLLQTSFNELCDAVNLRPPRNVRVQKKRRTVPAAPVSTEAPKQSIAKSASAAESKKPEPALTPLPEKTLTDVVVA